MNNFVILGKMTELFQAEALVVLQTFSQPTDTISEIGCEHSFQSPRVQSFQRSETDGDTTTRKPGRQYLLYGLGLLREAQRTDLELE